MFVFRKIWRTLFSWNTRFEIHPFALLPTKYHLNMVVEFRAEAKLKQPLKVFYKKCCSWNISIKNAGLEACSFIKKRLQYMCFPVNIAKFLRTPFWRTSVNSCFWLNSSSALTFFLKVFDTFPKLLAALSILFWLCGNFIEVVYWTLHKKWSFPLRISSLNVTKSAGNCGFGHIYWRNP